MIKGTSIAFILALIASLSACSVIEVNDRTTFLDINGDPSTELLRQVRAKKTTREWLLAQFGEPLSHVGVEGEQEAMTWRFAATKNKTTSILFLYKYNKAKIEERFLHVVLNNSLVKKRWLDKYPHIDEGDLKKPKEKNDGFKVFDFLKFGGRIGEKFSEFFGSPADPAKSSTEKVIASNEKVQEDNTVMTASLSSTTLSNTEPSIGDKQFNKSAHINSQSQSSIGNAGHYFKVQSLKAAPAEQPNSAYNVSIPNQDEPIQAKPTQSMSSDPAETEPAKLKFSEPT